MSEDNEKNGSVVKTVRCKTKELENVDLLLAVYNLRSFSALVRHLINKEAKAAVEGRL